MKYTYFTQGTCSSQIDLEIDDQGIIRCHGNLQGISVLLRGMHAEEAISKLQGIRCGYKNTSCPDQLATALRQALDKRDVSK